MYVDLAIQIRYVAPRGLMKRAPAKDPQTTTIPQCIRWRPSDFDRICEAAGRTRVGPWIRTLVLRRAELLAKGKTPVRLVLVPAGSPQPGERARYSVLCIRFAFDDLNRVHDAAHQEGYTSALQWIRAVAVTAAQEGRKTRETAV